VGGRRRFQRKGEPEKQRDDKKCFVLIVFFCNKLTWHSFIGGQKTLIVCHDRTEVKLIGLLLGCPTIFLCLISLLVSFPAPCLISYWIHEWKSFLLCCFQLHVNANLWNIHNPLTLFVCFCFWFLVDIQIKTSK
jgi:hypothetical protein